MANHSLLRDKNLLITFGITLTVVMGVSSIIPTLPLISRELNAPIATIGLVITAFTLPGIILTPVAGILADRYGRKKVLIPSLLLFALAGGACGFANDLTSLIVLRFFQGIGVAPLGVLYATIIGDLYEGNTRIKAMGYNAGVLSIGTAIYPAIGGFIGEMGWQAPFFLPFATLPMAYIAWRWLELPQPDASQGMGAYFKKAAKALRSRQALGLFSVSFLTFTMLYGPVITFIPILADNRFSATPSLIGALFALTSLGTAIGAARIGVLAERFKPHRLLLAGQIFYLLAMILVPHMTSFWWLLLPVFFFGLAQGLNYPNLMTLLSSLAPLEQRAAIMAVNGMTLRIAQTLAPLAVTSVYAIGGFNAVYAFGGATAVLMFLITAHSIR
ncbi:MFS transporter [Oleidesulfovibrio sp.]|uniref:MFS transporter n=1 Tax=Oleidesulfovibrio sp. TaxID=2909707 RepID=UPI003A851B7F